MRIIAGEWRGRQIKAPKGLAVRPTGDRVREAWMSIVLPELPSARVADLFAGSGALGLEALSRGAAFVDFVEQDPLAVRVLRENIATLGAGDRGAIHVADAMRFATRPAHRNGTGTPWDLAFADPPWRHGIAAALSERWLSAPFATIFVVEHEAREDLPGGGERRRYGDTAITIYRI